MESIGQKLTSAREAMGYSIEQVARDTNISKSYLEALEGENFEDFPGEPYLLGFLRNYSEYLGLDQEAMVNLYKNTMLQEQPIPMEELLEKKRRLPLPAVIAAAVVLCVVAVILFVYPGYVRGQSTERPKTAKLVKKTAEKETTKGKNRYEFADEIMERRFALDDVIVVKVDGKDYDLWIKEITDSVSLEYDGGSCTIAAGGEERIDLDNNGSFDIRILLRSISDKSAVFYIDRFVQASEPDGAAVEAVALDAETSNELVPPVLDLGQAGTPARVVKPVVIKRSAVPEPFNLNVTFRGYCFARYSADTGEREERYFTKGETLRLEATSGMLVWFSNAGAISAKVSGVDISFGDPGQVAVNSLNWEYNKESSEYELKLFTVY